MKLHFLHFIVAQPHSRVLELQWVLFNWLAAGNSLDDFLEAHPQVDRTAALVALDEASRAVVGQDSQLSVDDPVYPLDSDPATHAPIAA